jgi:hypothetical protein
MRQKQAARLAAFAMLLCLAGGATCTRLHAQQGDPAAAVNQLLHSMSPVKNAATDDQIREYFHFSHVVEDYKAAWIGSTDKYRAHGQPYLPDSFWGDVKMEMQDMDLEPAFAVWFKHTVSSELMDKVLDAYLKLGNKFPGSPMCIELGKAQSPMGDQWNQLTVLLTRQVIQKVYKADKAKIDDARTRYAAEHPGWHEQ